MDKKNLSRRDFLKAAGITLGGAALIGTGIAALDKPEFIGPLPSSTFGENNMTKKILVTYASRTGSTVGVAEAIGESLAEGGAKVDVLPMGDVRDLSAYSAVIAGSAIQAKAWLPEAMQWLHANRAELNRIPFAAFLVCMTLAMPNGEKYRSSVSDFLAPVRSVAKPISEGLFAGMLDIKKIPSLGDRISFRLSVLMGVWSEGDHRDWNAIRSWAESLRSRLN